MSFRSIPRDRLRCIMNVPAGHDSAHAEGEDRESGGTGGSGLASVGNLTRLEGHSPPSHHTTT